MKDMKGYLSEQPILHHIGKDERQTGNVHFMVENTLQSGFCLC